MMSNHNLIQLKPLYKLMLNAPYMCAANRHQVHCVLTFPNLSLSLSLSIYLSLCGVGMSLSLPPSFACHQID